MVNKTLPTLTETAIAADDSLFLTRRNGETSDEKITGANFKSYVLTTPTITGATIDNSVIGGSTPAAGTFTTLSLTNDLALADGGTGASLADPNDDRIMFWDDSAGAVTWLDISTGLAISTTNLSIDISNMTAMGAFPDATTDYIPIYDASAGTNLKITPSNFFKNIFGLTADATPDGAADYVVTYDASGAAAKKVLLDDLPSAGGGGGGSTALITGYKSGYYYAGMSYSRINTTVGTAVTADTLYARVLVLPATGTFDRISMYVHSAAAGKSVRVGIYEMGSNGFPGDLVLDAGTFTTDATGLKEITISQALTADKAYYLAFVSDGTPQLSPNITSAQADHFNYMGVDADPQTNYAAHAVTISHTYGALPDPFGTPTGQTGYGTAPHGIVLRSA